MQRQSLRLSDEELAAEFGRIMILFTRAFPRGSDLAAFCRLVNEAGARGHNWVEALEHAAHARSSVHI